LLRLQRLSFGDQGAAVGVELAEAAQERRWVQAAGTQLLLYQVEMFTDEGQVQHEWQYCN
jgi:hypothetical protein